MLTFLILSQIVLADPGRTTASLTGGANLEGGSTLRGGLDYGVANHLSLAGEAGLGGPTPMVGLGGGVRLDAIDSQWWRVGLVAWPELLTDGDTANLGLRGGVRVNWLAFWGLSFVGRVDRVAPGLDLGGSSLCGGACLSRSLTGAPGWTEWGLGLAVRM